MSVAGDGVAGETSGARDVGGGGRGGGESGEREGVVRAKRGGELVLAAGGGARWTSGKDIHDVP